MYLSSSGTSFLDRLKVFKDKLLRINWSNRSILLKKIQKKWTFDLMVLEEPAATQIVEKILVGKKDHFLVPDNSLDENDIQHKTHLITLNRQEDLIEDESGIHDFFVGFPFLIGNIQSDHYVRAPLILFPVRLEHRKEERRSGWFLIFEQDELPMWNRTLLAALNRMGKLSIPDDFDEQLDDTIEAIRESKDYSASTMFARLQTLFDKYSLPFGIDEASLKLSSLPDLKKEQLALLQKEPLRISSNLVLGIFPQATDAIYQDYDMLENAEPNRIDLGVLGKMLQIPIDEEEPEDSPPSTNEDLLDKSKDMEINAALESDASQDAVILEAQKAECVVVRGPPGTGKSQLIVNLVTNAMSKGQRIAVVCQKRAALTVVQERLAKVGLSEYALLIEDEKKDRRPNYERLHQLHKSDFKRESNDVDAELELTSKKIDKTIEDLNNIVLPQTEKIHGVTLGELYLKVIPGFVNRLSLEGIENKIDYPQFQVLLKKLPELEKGALRFDTEFYPFALRKDFAKLGISDVEKLRRDIDLVLTNATREYYVLANSQIYDETIKEVVSFQTNHKKSLKFLNADWRTYGKKGQLFLEANDATLDDDAVSAMLSKLRNGRELLTSIVALNNYLTEPAINSLVNLSASRDKLKMYLKGARDAAKDFDQIQEHDSRVSKLEPNERYIFEGCKSQLRNTRDWDKEVKQLVLLKWIDQIERAHPQLMGDPFIRYVALRKELQELMDKKNKLVTKKIISDIHKRISKITQSITMRNSNGATLDWRKFDYELEKSRRVKPMRQLFESYKPLVKQMALCWLVSPEMLSRVIPFERGFFDLVVFDEASQLSVERALPALYRAKRVVVAGDEKQLPPSDLFNILDIDEDDEEENEETSEIAKAESLLMLARRAFSFRYLSWHYRSESQELIDFSNHAFYEGKLLVAGNVNKNPAKPAIRWVACNGSWDDRCNIPEAEKVVDEVFEILSRANGSDDVPSIGVVTFNDAQRDQILTSISDRRDKDAAFSELYSLTETASKTKPDRKIFVKNIENVQGDERDVIIFSVGYSRDPLGNFRIRFGSLNREGGENRLNVAVTRARKEIVICCSFEPEDLPAERSKREGPKLLKDYLLYAKAISERRDDSVKDILGKLSQHNFERKQVEGPRDLEFESPLEEQVQKALSGMGYEVDTQVGYSGYRIDLGVVHPKNPNKYVLAIECDGATFHSARSSRERDLVRQRFLESRGWKVDRIWSRNWWRNRDGELQRLQKRIEEESIAEPPVIKRE